MVLEFYYDLLSQPCRAVYLFLKFAKIPYEDKLIDLIKREHYNEDFVKKNPFHKVPLIDNDGFVMAESVAIMRYLAVKYDVPEHLFPRSDPEKMARVDEFLNWQHLSLRKPCIQVFLNIFRSRVGVGRFTKQPLDEELVKAGREEVAKAVTHIADYFLKDQPYIGGDDISVADLLGISELLQLQGVNEDGLYTSNKKVNDWMERVKGRLQPYFEECDQKRLKLREMFMAAKE